MACLVFRYRQAHSVDGIGDSGGLQTIELVMRWESQCFTKHYPSLTEDTPICSMFAWLEVTPEQIEAVGVTEHIEVKHHLQNSLGYSYHCILAVLAELMADEKRLVTDSYVLNTDIGQFVGAYQGVVVHQASE